MLRERVRRSINNASELRELLLELLTTDEELADMLRGPPVSTSVSRVTCGVGGWGWRVGLEGGVGG